MLLCAPSCYLFTRSFMVRCGGASARTILIPELHLTQKGRTLT